MNGNMLKIRQILDFYTLLTPLNREGEKKDFFCSSKKNPIFKYPSAGKNIGRAREILLKSKIDFNSPAAGFYKELKEEVMLKALMVEKLKDPEKFTRLSKKIFGFHSKSDKNFALDIISGPGEDFAEPLTAKEIKREIKKEIEKNNIKGWKVELKSNMASKMSVKPDKRRVYINCRASFFREEAARLKVHEINVHLFRALNGARQNWEIFSTGTARYGETEEGLAVYFENFHNSSPPEQMRIYAGRLMAVELALEKSFRETFTALLGWFPAKMAYRFTERAKRGLIDTSLPGAFTRDIHYITGYRKIKKIAAEKDFPRLLFAGKVALREREKIREMMQKNLLTSPLYLP